MYIQSIYQYILPCLKKTIEFVSSLVTNHQTYYGLADIGARLLNSDLVFVCFGLFLLAPHGVWFAC